MNADEFLPEDVDRFVALSKMLGLTPDDIGALDMDDYAALRTLAMSDSFQSRIRAAAALGQRAARLVDFMLGDCAPHLTENFGEINEVLIEARKRGWLETAE